MRGGAGARKSMGMLVYAMGAYICKEVIAYAHTIAFGCSTRTSSTHKGIHMPYKSRGLHSVYAYASLSITILN